MFVSGPKNNNVQIRPYKGIWGMNTQSLNLFERLKWKHFSMIFDFLSNMSCEPKLAVGSIHVSGMVAAAKSSLKASSHGRN